MGWILRNKLQLSMLILLSLKLLSMRKSRTNSITMSKVEGCLENLALSFSEIPTPELPASLPSSTMPEIRLEKWTAHSIPTMTLQHLKLACNHVTLMPDSPTRSLLTNVLLENWRVNRQLDVFPLQAFCQKAHYSAIN